LRLRQPPCDEVLHAGAVEIGSLDLTGYGIGPVHAIGGVYSLCECGKQNQGKDEQKS